MKNHATVRFRTGGPTHSDQSRFARMLRSAKRLEPTASRANNGAAMPTSTTEFRGRKAVSIENAAVRVTVLTEGGHIAEVLHKEAGINPLWVPHWESIEPSQYDARHYPEYGNGVDARLLAGIMGHNVCLDIFGGPSTEEAAAGLTPHGEAAVAAYDIDADAAQLTMCAALPLAQLRFERRLALRDAGVRIREKVENLGACDRPIGWTQHVTLGPPFLEKGVTEFRVSATRSKVLESQFGIADYLTPAAEFDWPHAPRTDGGFADLRRYTDLAVSSAYTAHLMDPAREHGFFAAFAPSARLAFGYIWKRSDFPWMGIWEENHSRAASPWNGVTLTRGMEFGVSPMPESRREMIDRGRLFGTPTYRWIPARGTLEAEYWIVIRQASDAPDSLEWPG